MVVMERGRVMEVLDGNRVRVMKLNPTAKGGRPQETIVQFLGASIGSWRHGSPLAFRSRQWLRTRVIGREVSYKIYKSISSIESYGYVLMVGSAADLPDGANVALVMLAKGLLQWKEPDNVEIPTDVKADIDTNIELARTAKVGLHDESLAKTEEVVKRVKSFEDVNAIYTTIKDKEISGYVEAVMDDLNILVWLNEVKCFVSVGIYGINNRFNRFAPYADEEKFFIEYRILNRDIKFTPLAVLDRGRREPGQEGRINNSPFLYGKIALPQGDIAVSLIRDGFAELDYINFPRLNNCDFGNLYHETQKGAKAKNVRKWNTSIVPENVVPSGAGQGGQSPTKNSVGSSGDGKNKWYGVVTVIHRPDAMTVERIGADNQIEEVRVILNGIANPLRGNEGATVYEVPYVYESMLLCRKAYNGLCVLIVEDAVKDYQNGDVSHVNMWVTMYTNKVEAKDGIDAYQNDGLEFDQASFTTCINNELLATGLGKIDNNSPVANRSAEYENMREASMVAIRKMIGHYSQEALNSRSNIEDLTLLGCRTRSAGYYSELSSKTELRAYVDHIQGVSRMFVTFLDENVKATVRMGDVEPPQRSDSKHYRMLLNHLRHNLLYKTIKVKLTQKQKSGVYLGTMKTLNDVDVGLWAVRNGLAQLYPLCRNPDYVAAYNEAVSKKLNMHENDTGAEAATRPGTGAPTDALASKLDAVLLAPLVELQNSLKNVTGAQISRMASGMNSASMNAHDSDAMKREEMEEDPPLGAPSLRESQQAGRWGNRGNNNLASKMDTAKVPVQSKPAQTTEIDMFNAGINLSVLISAETKGRAAGAQGGFAPRGRRHEDGESGTRDEERVAVVMKDPVGSDVILEDISIVENGTVAEFYVTLNDPKMVSMSKNVKQCLAQYMDKISGVLPHAHHNEPNRNLCIYKDDVTKTAGRGVIGFVDRKGIKVYSLDGEGAQVMGFDQVFPLHFESRSAEVLKAIMPSRIRCRLALVRTSRSYVHEADYCFNRLLNDYPVSGMRIIQFDPVSAAFDVILDTRSHSTINEIIVERGYCRLNLNLKHDLNQDLQRAKKSAIKKRVVIWKYANTDSD